MPEGAAAPASKGAVQVSTVIPWELNAAPAGDPARLGRGATVRVGGTAVAQVAAHARVTPRFSLRTSVSPSPVPRERGDREPAQRWEQGALEAEENGR
jgi:hypothetical protein